MTGPAAGGQGGEPARAYLVGLTGGMAAGKSTVAAWLAEAGFLVVDADRLVADLYRPGQPGAAAIGELFGDEVLGADGGVEHAALARRIFSDPEARRRVEAVVHPLVRSRFETLAARHEGVAVLEAALLVEAGYTPIFDLVVTVEAEVEARLERAVARGLDRAAAERRLAAQGDGSTRRAAAHRVLRNDGSEAELRRQVDELVGELVGELRRHRPATAESQETEP